VIVTLDLGTTVTKADVWVPSGRIAGGRVDLATQHPLPRRDEQDPAIWWPAVLEACAAARRADPTAWASTTAIGLTGARQTIVAVAEDGTALGPAILWSDRRARVEAEELAARMSGAEPARQRTGLVMDGGSVASKLAWLAAHEPDQLARARWVLTPRDVVAHRLTGEVGTDVTMASATGCYDPQGGLLPELVGEHTRLFAPAFRPATVVGTLTAEATAELCLPPGVRVVIGAGDRACEAIGAGATTTRPTVSWGTTANASRPVVARPEPVPGGLATTRAAEDEGWLVEAGLAAAGSLLSWLRDRTGHDVDALVRAAADVPPGAHGVIMLPWLGGARAPWWRDDVDVELVGVRTDHGPGDLARAAVEGVARDLARCIDAMAADGGPAIEALSATGRGAAEALWLEILTATTGLPAVTRRSAADGSTGSAAVGAAVLAARAIEEDWTADRLDPVVSELAADSASVERYAELADAADRVAQGALDRAWPEPERPT
jgi:xylulokinase